MIHREIVSLSFGTGFPCALVAEYSSPSNVVIAGVPRAQTIRGLISLICSIRYGLHASTSDLRGARLLGGLHLTMFVMKTSALLSPIDSKSSVSSFPAAPTKGLPCSSSFWPGPSPTKIILASAGPSPGTAFFLLLWSSHLVQLMISEWTVASSADPSPI